MRVIKPSYEILYCPDNLKLIEIAGRTCYKSEDLITEDSAPRFVEKIVKSGHHSVIEHLNITVRFIFDRGVLAEHTRHRLCAHSAESTRYCSYNGAKFGNEITVIAPSFWGGIPAGQYKLFNNDKDILYENGEGLFFVYSDFVYKKYSIIDGQHGLRHRFKKDILKVTILMKNWLESVLSDEKRYLNAVRLGAKPEEARSVLPNSLKTEIVTTANIREWRHILKLRTSKAAHPQIREVMAPLLAELKTRIPVVFDDIEAWNEQDKI